MSEETLPYICFCFLLSCTRRSAYSQACCSIALWTVISAIQVYPFSEAAPDAVLIPVATVTNSTGRWAGVCFNAAEYEKQGQYSLSLPDPAANKTRFSQSVYSVYGSWSGSSAA